jgi:hypothetical protein
MTDDIDSRPITADGRPMADDGRLNDGRPMTDDRRHRQSTDNCRRILDERLRTAGDRIPITLDR